MPIRTKPSGGFLSLYVHLSSSRGAAMPAQALRQQFGNGIDRLLENGAAYAGRPLSVVKCPACYEDHTAEVTYDAASRRSWIFCPEAGRVAIDDAALGTLHLNTNWLPDQLAAALNLAPSPPRRVVIERAAWLLGDTVVGRTKLSVALAIGLRDAGEIDKMIAGLCRRKVLDAGLLLVAGSQLPECVSAASQYATIALDEIADIENGSIRTDHARLAAWVRGLLHGRKPSVRETGGRQPISGNVLLIFQDRRTRGERYASKNAEATAILGEWQTFYPDGDLPGRSTVRKHLPEPKLDWRSLK